jgi:hypothetical protein
MGTFSDDLMEEQLVELRKLSFSKKGMETIGTCSLPSLSSDIRTLPSHDS